MIRHTVLIRFPDGCPAGEIASILGQVEDLKFVVPGMVDFHAGTDVTPVPLAQGYTHAFTIDFEDVAARDGYWMHPGHIAVAERLVPLLDKGAQDVLIIQFPFEASHRA